MVDRIQRLLRSRRHPSGPGGVSREFVGNLRWQYVTTGTTLLSGFAYTLMVARWLGSAEFGVLALGLGFATVVFQLADLRLNEAVVKYVLELHATGKVAESAAAVRLSLLANVCSASLAFSLVVLLVPLSPPVLREHAAGSLVLILCALSLFVTSLGGPTSLGVIRVFGLFREQALITIWVQALKLVLTAAGVLGLGLGVVGVAGLAAGCSILNSLCLVLVAWRCWCRRMPVSPVAVSVRLIRDRWREMCRFVSHMYGFSVLGVPTKELDVAFLGWFGTAEVVGHYRVAKSFMSAIWAAADPVFYVTYPELVKFWSAGRFGPMRDFLRRVICFTGLGGLVLASGAAWVVPVIIQLMAGEPFADARVYFWGMLWGIVIGLPLFWVNPLLLAAGRSDLSLRAAVVAAVITTGLYVVLVPALGGLGAAVGNAAGGAVGGLTAGWMVWRNGLLARTTSSDQGSGATGPAPPVSEGQPAAVPVVIEVEDAS